MLLSGSLVTAQFHVCYLCVVVICARTAAAHNANFLLVLCYHEYYIIVGYLLNKLVVMHHIHI